MPSLLRVPRLNPTLVPAVPVEVDWSHPLARGLLAFYLLNDLSFRNLGSSAVPGVPSPGGNGAAMRISSSTIGPMVAFAGGYAIDSNQAGPVFNPGTGDFSMSCLLAYTAGGTVIMAQSSAPWLGTIGGIRINTYVTDIISPDIFADGRLHFVVATRLNGNLYLYVDGVLQGTTPSTNDLSGSRLTIGRFGPAGGYRFTGLIGAAAWRKCGLDADEVAWLSREPFAMLRPIQPRRRFVQVGGYPPLTMGLAVDLAPAALDAHAAVATSADFAAPLADAAFAAALASAIAADSAATLAAADLTASADSTIAADFAGSTAPAALDAAAHSTIAAAGAATLAPATLDASAVSAITAAFSAGLATATLAATITVGIGTRVANLAATLAPATIAATMTSIVSAGVSAATAPATVSASTVAAIAAEAVVVVRPADLTASAASAIDAAFVVALAAAALDGTITVAGAIVWPVTVRVGRMIALPAVRRSVSVPVSRRMISIPD